MTTEPPTKGETMTTKIAYVESKRVTDKRCPHCGAYKAMPNPIEHLRDRLPLLCLPCGKSFENQGADSE